MKDKIRWAVIGSGGIAKRKTIPEGILKASNATLVAVYDIDPKVNKEVANDFNAFAADSIEDLLKSDVSAVYIATPANLHYKHCLKCCEFGKNVLCEKPLGMTVTEAEKMITAFGKKNLLGTALMMRFQTQHIEAKKMISEGKLGKQVYARAQLSCWYPPIKGAWRQEPSSGGGGSLIDMGGHCIDLLELFFGEVIKVSCFVNNSIHTYQSEDSACAMLFFENGAMATVDTFFCIPDNSSKNKLELYGSKGSILCEGTIGQGNSGKMTAFLEDESKNYDANQNRSINEGLVISPPARNLYQAEIEEFSQAIIEGREPSNNSLLGLRSQKILAACYDSARTGKAIEIN